MPFLTAPDIVATPGAPDANSYATLAQADAYHEGHPYGDAWADPAATVEQRSRALVLATRLLDAQVAWQGTPVTAAQALEWPRYGVRNAYGGVVAWSAIPIRIVEATCEYARLLLGRDLTAERETDAAGITRLKAGPVEVQFGSGGSAAPLKMLPDSVRVLLRGYTEIVTGTGAQQVCVPLVRT